MTRTLINYLIFSCASCILCFTSVSAESLNTVEILSQINSLSTQAKDLGELAQSKIQDTQLKELNRRIIQDHKVSAKALEDLAKQLNINLAKENQTNSHEKLELMKGRSFEQEFLNSEINLHAQLLDSLENKYIPAASSPLIKATLKNILPKVSSLLQNMRALKAKYRPLQKS